MPGRFERARRLVFFPVPDDWEPDPFGETPWLEELEALTSDEQRQVDRFGWGPDDELDIELPDEG